MEKVLNFELETLCLFGVLPPVSLEPVASLLIFFMCVTGVEPEAPEAPFSSVIISTWHIFSQLVVSVRF